MEEFSWLSTMDWVSCTTAAVGEGSGVASTFISLSCKAVRYHSRFSPRVKT